MTKGKKPILPRGQRGGGEGVRSMPALWRRTACQNNAFTQPHPRLKRGKATETPQFWPNLLRTNDNLPSLHVQRSAKEEPVLLYSMCLNTSDHTWLRTSSGGKKFRLHQGEHRVCVLCACSSAGEGALDHQHLHSDPVQPLSPHWAYLWRNVLCQLMIVLLHPSYTQGSCLSFLPAR